MPFSSYALQYSSVDVQQVINSSVDLFVTEGGPLTNFASSAITATELATLQAAGTQVAAYINVSVTDDARPYWDPAWTDDGTDTGIPTAFAPAWLINQPTNPFGYVVDFSDQDWQDVVIAQAVDLVTSGFDGVMLDDFAQYFVAGATGLTISEQATIMMEFALEIDAAIKVINPNAVLITNGNPYVVTDAVGGATSAESVDFLSALDAMLLESFFGINGCQDAAIAHAKTYIQPGADLLALEYGGTAYQNYLVAEEAALEGMILFAAGDASYSSFGAVSNATNGADVLFGTDCGEHIVARDGDDLVKAGLGDDYINGGFGLDTIYGQAGDDTLRGKADNDTLYGGGGDDHLYGGFANDILFGEGGNDELNGGGEDDTLYGNKGDDSLSGTSGLDTLYGGKGRDYLSGGGSNDFLAGGAHRDVLEGDGGHDELRGQDGYDILDGGFGNDFLIGGSGNDEFIFSLGYGSDFIHDFQDNNDTLVLDGNLWGGGLTAQEVVDTHATIVGSSTVMDFGNGDLLELRNIHDVQALVDDIQIV